MFQVVALVPVYALTNRELSDTCTRVPSDVSTVVLICNDNNRTVRRRVQALRECERCEALFLPYQVGKAEAIRRGIRHACANIPCEAVLQLDGDLKQDPEDLTQVIRALRAGADLALCNRYAFQDLTTQEHRKTIAEALSDIICGVTGLRVPDGVCGMRGYSLRMAQHFAGLKCYGYGVELEQILLATMHKALIEVVPIKSNRQADWTPAEKIEDNWLVLLSYADELGLEESRRSVICHVLALLKARESFRVDLAQFGSDGQVVFEYRKADNESWDCYSLSRI